LKRLLGCSGSGTISGKLLEEWKRGTYIDVGCLEVDAPANRAPTYQLRVRHVNAILIIDMLGLTEYKGNSNGLAITKALVITAGMIDTTSIQLL